MSNFVREKTKGQQLKGKIVSEFFITLFSQFLTVFHNFSPQDFPLQNKGFQLKGNKREEKIIKSSRGLEFTVFENCENYDKHFRNFRKLPPPPPGNFRFFS